MIAETSQTFRPASPASIRAKGRAHPKRLQGKASNLRVKATVTKVTIKETDKARATGRVTQTAKAIMIKAKETGKIRATAGTTAKVMQRARISSFIA